MDKMTEFKKSKLLAEKISCFIGLVDDNLSVITFAQAIARVIEDDYGQHNAEKFLNELNKKLS